MKERNDSTDSINFEDLNIRIKQILNLSNYN